MAHLDFYFDYSSPFAYLGATQVGAVAKRHDAQLNLEPFFLGGLFKSIGTPLVPFAEMPQPKQKLAMNRRSFHSRRCRSQSRSWR